MPDILSKREREVLRLTAEGLTPEQIGVKLHLLTKTVHTYMMHMRRKLGAANNEQAVLKAAWYHAHLLAGCVIKHGTAKALDWHEDNEIPLCEECGEFAGEPVPARKASAPYRRIAPLGQRLKRGAPVDCGTIQAARRHISSGDRINDLTCGCREAYQEWWREYQRNKVAI